MPRSQLFLWFRAPESQAAAVLAGLQALRDLRAEQPGPPLLFYRRSALDSVPGELQTWMEVHPPIPTNEMRAYAGWLARSVEQIGLAALAHGERHAEWFECV
jgi:hypothetical protein